MSGCPADTVDRLDPADLLTREYFERSHKATYLLKYINNFIIINQTDAVVKMLFAIFLLFLFAVFLPFLFFGYFFGSLPFLAFLIFICLSVHREKKAEDGVYKKEGDPRQAAKKTLLHLFLINLTYP